MLSNEVLLILEIQNKYMQVFLLKLLHLQQVDLWKENTAI
jgi:hypothetical protein